jgi:hypothetical protein
MTDQIAIYNRALGSFGARTTVQASEIASPQSNEAIYLNLIYVPFLRRLQRMAPWACCFNTVQLNYITSVYGTPENTVAQAIATLNGQQVSIWAKGQPVPPWAYEYQYPVDCVKACWVTPQTATGFASGIPITTAVTGGAPSFWQGPPVKYSIGVDQFYNVTAAAPAAAGLGYNIGDLITLALQLTPTQISNILSTFQPQAPQGAAPVLQVTGIGAGGAITSVAPVAVTPTEDTPFAGSLFYQYGTQPVAQGTTTGLGSGATFNLTYGGPSDQRVILTNQEFAILNYVRYVTDPNVWDDAFQEAFVLILGAACAREFTGSAQTANLMIAQANAMIQQARGDDANEGLKVNDVTPDWLRVRGIDFVEDYSGPYNTGFNWGAIWPGYT